MRNVLTSTLEVAAAGSMSTGAFLAHPAAGLIVAGAFALWFAKALSPKAAR